MIARGRLCPRCGEATERTRTLPALRLLRLVMPALCSRRCYGCGWRGLALVEKRTAAT